MLAPHQPGLATHHRQVDQLHLGAILHPSSTSTAGARRRPCSQLNMNPQRTARYIGHADEPHLGQTNEQFAGADRVADHTGSPSEGVENRQTGLAEPLLRAGDPQTPLIPEVPS